MPQLQTFSKTKKWKLYGSWSITIRANLLEHTSCSM